MGTRERGELTVFLAAAPGMGKTTAMLEDGNRRAATGEDVVVALLETHGRDEVDQARAALECVGPLHVCYRNSQFTELDVDGVLRRRPAVVLVDELAHTNVVGSRHDKRWQDVEELLSLGIDVVTNVNIAHLDSLNDQVETITGVAQHETVPDELVAHAGRVVVVDMPTELLRSRVEKGAVFGADRVEAALGGYYRAENVQALRDLLHGWLAEHGVEGAEGDRHHATRPAVVAALTGALEGRHVVRRAAQLAAAGHGQLIGVHVREPSGLRENEPAWLDEQRRLLAELGGRYVEREGVDVSRAVLDVCRSEGAGQLVLGATRRSHRDELLHGTVITRTIRAAGPVEVHVVPAHRPPAGLPPAKRWPVGRSHRVPLPRRRRQLGWVVATIAPLAVAGAMLPLRATVGLSGALFGALLAVVASAAIGGIGPAATSIVVGFVASDFLYAVPYYSLRVYHAIDLIALIAFAVVGGVIGALVDLLARQSVQVTGAHAEAQGLAQLAGEVLADNPEALPRLAADLRATFDLDAVAVLRREGDTWHSTTAIGSHVPVRPEDTPLTAELTDGQVLALVVADPASRNSSLLESLVTAMRNRRERSQLERVEGSAG